MRKPFFGLIVKIGVVVVLVEILALATLGAYYSRSFARELDARTEAQVRLPGVLMNRQLLRYESVADPEIMAELVGEEFVDGLVLGVQGEVFYALDPSRVGRNVAGLPELASFSVGPEVTRAQTRRWVAGDETYVASLTPLVAYEGARPFFFSYVRVRTTVSEAEKTAAARRFFLGSLLCVLLTSAAIIGLTRLLVTRPLRRVEESADRIAAGDLDQELRSERRDEIGSLARSFARMRDAVRDQIGRLEEFNRTLEEQVDARTQELREHAALLEREVEERRRAEQAVRESRDLFDAFMRNLPAAAFVKDAEGRYVYANDAAERLGAGEPVPLAGKTDVQLWSPEQADRLRANDGRVLAGGTTLRETETVAVRGRERHLLVTKFPLVREGTAPLLGGIALDVTDQVLADRERRELAAKLHRAQKMEVVGTLAGGVAHDLNNILSAVVGYPELMLLELPADSRLRRPLEAIRSSGERAAAIVQDLLTLARRGVSSRTRVGLNQVVEAYRQSPECASLLAYHPAVRLEVDLAPDLLPISGSHVHLAKTVANLVSNAAEAMPGGGTVRVSTRNRYVDRPLPGYEQVEKGDYVMLSVADEGTGIAPEEVGRIFEPFFTKKVMGRSGTGLGLAVVWGTVKDHEGFVGVESAPGRGSTFDVYLPVERGAAADEVADGSAPPAFGHGERVLVVDDVAEQRELAVAMLERLGYRAGAVASGEAAVERLAAEPADLLVLDMIMDPGIDGCETYRRVAALHPGQRAILASGYSETERVREAQRLGAGGYLRKPYTLRALGAAIRAELDRTPAG